MIDPTIEFVDVEIEGKIYKMAFDLESLADGEDALLASGVRVQLLECLEVGNLTANAVRTLFALSLRKAQPELPYAAARSLVTLRNIQFIRAAVLSAWCASVGMDGEDSEKKAETADTEETKLPAVEKISVENNAG